MQAIESTPRKKTNNNMKVFICTILLSVPFASVLFAQNTDSLKLVNLPDVEVREFHLNGGIDRMPELQESVIYAGKKTEVIQLDVTHADLSINNARQVFAKVPGMSVWENDGSGIQVGIATRGLSPNRSWEFNVRQNGYDISSEAFGYPEAYYTPPMEALEKIEVIRGAASLQYGPQFGGLVNYRIKRGDPNKPFTFETQQTVGSYGLFNTYNAMGGTCKKLSYYGFLHHRAADGWRHNSRYSTLTGHVSAQYQLSKKMFLSAEYTSMDYSSQQPGGLTDAQFEADNRQSSRARNWFGAPFNSASLTARYEFAPGAVLQVRSFLNKAERNSVGYTKAINIKDSINSTTLAYAERQVDRDFYTNYGSEARVSFNYTLFGGQHAFAGGLRAYSGNTERRQLGVGTTGSDFDLSLTKADYGRSLNFGTTNFAAFAENIFHVGSHLKLVPGLRYEYIENSRQGYINTTTAGALSDAKRSSKILLYGIGSEFALFKTTTLYANYSLSYRPVTFSELTPSATTEVIDPNLKDAQGYNVDAGYRGFYKNVLNFDLGVFYLNYENRIGTITQNGAPFKTNIGTSVSKGLESYVEIDLLKLLIKEQVNAGFSIFSSNAIIDARYRRWDNPAIAADPSKSIEGKRVENAPEYIHRVGATGAIGDFTCTFQLSSVGAVFTDAANTEVANATGTVGKLAGYEVMDFSLSWKFMERYNFKAGANNLTDAKYATRRAGGYPGPGILPGNGRTVFVAVGASF